MKLATMPCRGAEFSKGVGTLLAGVGVYYFLRYCVEMRDGVVLGLGSVEDGLVVACVRIAAVQRSSRKMLQVILR